MCMCHTKKKSMGTVPACVVAALSAVGAVTLIVMMKKNAGTVAKKIRKIGKSCAEGIEGAMDTVADRIDE